MVSCFIYCLLFLFQHVEENGCDPELSFQIQPSGASTARGGHSARGPALMTGFTRGMKLSRPGIERLHIDMIGEQFWTDFPEILDSSKR